MSRGAAAAVLLALGAPAVLGAGCGQDCCTIDSFPIALARAPLGGPGGAAPGALLARATTPTVAGGQPFPMLIDTGSPITVLNESPGAPSLDLQRRPFDLVDASGATSPPAIRARFRDVAVLNFPVAPVGDAATFPLGVLGGDLLRAFSVEMRFAGVCQPGVLCPALTFWRHQGASIGFLEDAGYAVIRFSLFGGGEATASSDPDVVGLRGPLEIPPTRVVLRACVAPDAFDPATTPREHCCTRGAEIPIVTGVDLSLLVATGVGPVVLGRAAWDRVQARLETPPVMTQAPLYIAAWPTPIAADWTTIPRFALVDLEAGSNADPGPCIELGRARRIEWVSYQNYANPGSNFCVQPCDTDPRQPDLAQNSAAYLELGGAVPVAVIADEEPWLQGLRFDVRPEGPEVDGVVGAGALGGSRLELDYLSTPARALFSCEPGSARTNCWASPRCPRLPDRTQQHLCFGLMSPEMLPPTCAPSGC